MSCIRVMWTGLALIGAALAGLAPSGAQQARMQTPVPLPTSAEALAGKYGVRAVDHVTAALEASVDRTCLAARGGVGAPTRERVVEWLTRYGQGVLDRASAPAVEQAAVAALIASHGSGAPAELQALAQRPQVQEMLATGLALRLDAAVDTIVAALARHLELARVRLARPLDPFAARARDLTTLREERQAAASRAVARYQARHPAAPELQRFITLYDAWTSALGAAADRASAPRTAFEGIIPELRASCIGQP